MKIEKKSWSAKDDWKPSVPGELGERADLVLVFASTAIMRRHDFFDEIKKAYPKARLLGCSTSGEIMSDRVCDDTLVLTAVHFEKSHLKGARMQIEKMEDSYRIGQALSGKFEHDGLRHIFVLSDGLNVNGSELVKGLAEGLPEGVTITGGLSGDGADFKETFVMLDEPPARNIVAAVAFYGPALRIGYGSMGGWDPFGPERVITKSKGNVLYELDNKSALELYKKYLGEHAKGLPATGLLFPLSLRGENQDKETGIVRTILAIDEKEQSMTFAGDMPEGAFAQLMKANFDRLIDGAKGAAKTSAQPLSTANAQLAVLISCVGRKLILKQRVEEEVEAVHEVLGKKVAYTGFYSYGEISPFTPNAQCELHNQTMTITTFAEE